jgi:murein DD-endopeptidase MepM/ murein hydrolase activator NlpD
MPLFLLNFVLSRGGRKLPFKLLQIVAQYVARPSNTSLPPAALPAFASEPSAQPEPPAIRSAVRVALGLGTAALMSSLFVGVAAFGTVSDSPFPPETQSIEKALEPKIEALGSNPADIFVHEDRLQRNDTLGTLLDRLGMDDAEASRLLRNPETAKPLRALRPGATVHARTGADGTLQRLWFLAQRDQVIGIEPQGDGFKVDSQQAELKQEVQMKSGEIRTSLFSATDAAGVPDSVAVQLADIFGSDVDFHRDLRRGDHFTVVYEQTTSAGRVVRSGRVLAAEFINQNRAFRAVWFADAQATGGATGAYYTPEGKSLRKAFLRSPLEFSRITSGFSMRFHPILNQWRMHKGVDYGAPSGTRVKATSDGVIEFAGREGGYGNLVIVRHNGGYSTRYAHLSGFAVGVRKGARVSQGDLVGFVGQTGWATGPHLHYEFRVNDDVRNPLTMAFPAAQPITAENLAAFRAVATPLAARLDVLRTTNLAVLE